MGSIWIFFFGEKDEVLVSEIAKAHKMPKDLVEKHYRKMLDGIRNDLQTEVKE